jgi:protein TonB
MASNSQAARLNWFFKGRQAMFEDSTFESAGRIRTRSRRWMIAAFAFNASIVLAFVLVPLLCLEALPPKTLTTLIPVPPAPHVQQQEPKPMAQTPRPADAVPQNPYAAPKIIPDKIYFAKDPEPVVFVNPDTGPGIPGSIGPDDPFSRRPAPRVVHPAPSGPMNVPSRVEAGLILHKTIPVYPSIGLAMHAQGTVILAATISKSGNIENLHVVSGPAVLQQAALDAVSTWRYRPYLLDGQPVEVETTVEVIFRLGQ